MGWVAGIILYILLVWIFLRFFHFVAEVDQDIETMETDNQKEIEREQRNQS